MKLLLRPLAILFVMGICAGPSYANSGHDLAISHVVPTQQIADSRIPMRFNALVTHGDYLFAAGTHLVAWRKGKVTWAVKLPCGAFDALATASGPVLAASCDAPSRVDLGLKRPAVLRFDLKGNLSWSVQIDFGMPALVLDIASGVAGEIFLTARRDGCGPKSTCWEYVLFRLKADGRVEWAKSFHRESDDSSASLGDIVGTPNGTLAVIIDGGLGLLDLDGTIKSIRQYRMIEQPLRMHHMAIAGDAIALAVGHFTYGIRGADPLVLSIDAQGGVNWARLIDASPSDNVDAIAGGPSGAIVVAGATRRMGPTLEDKVSRMEGWLVQLNQEGDIVRSTVTGKSDDGYLRAVTVADFGAIAVGGSSANWPNQLILSEDDAVRLGCVVNRMAETRAYPVHVQGHDAARYRVVDEEIEWSSSRLEATHIAVTQNLLCPTRRSDQ